MHDTDIQWDAQDVSNCSWALKSAENHTEECRRRIEAELNKTSEGQERLDHAKERLDIRTAEI